MQGSINITGRAFSLSNSCWLLETFRSLLLRNAPTNKTSPSDDDDDDNINS
jgi:hypothetical protein